VRETHEHVGARHLPCAQCRMPVWHRDHVHQAPVEMQISTNLEDRRDTRDPERMGAALWFQKYWQAHRGLHMTVRQVADLLPCMDLDDRRVTEIVEYLKSPNWTPIITEEVFDQFKELAERENSVIMRDSAPPCYPNTLPKEYPHEIESMGPLKGKQFTIYTTAPKNGKTQ
jgi:hypothetical protein